MNSPAEHAAPPCGAPAGGPADAPAQAPAGKTGVLPAAPHTIAFATLLTAPTTAPAHPAAAMTPEPTTATATAPAPAAEPVGVPAVAGYALPGAPHAAAALAALLAAATASEQPAPDAAPAAATDALAATPVPADAPAPADLPVRADATSPDAPPAGTAAPAKTPAPPTPAARTPAAYLLPGPPSIARRARRGGPVPGLRYRPVAPADPVKVAEVDARLEAWARELDLFPPAWNGDFTGFQFGRAVVLQHPAAVDVERLTVAGKLLLAENLVDSCYCEEDEGRGGAHHGLGGPLLMAQSAIDPYHGTPESEAQWRQGMQADGPLRSYHWAVKDYATFATPSQSTRFVHDIARLHMGYLAEAAWAEAKHMPQVWEYLVMRQFNNFRPCLSIVDAVDGYELPEPLYSRPEIQRITALACNATTIVNDLYSFAKELASDPDHLNLPRVVAANRGHGLKAGYLESVVIHNRIMAAFEEEAATLAATSPLVGRYARSLSDWVAGNHEWHATNTHRYHLPDYW